MSHSILVVEDHDANRAAIMRRLVRLGFTVVEADDGESAVTQFKAAKPDLVLMDLSMPRVSGFDALAAIRKLEGGEATPVIAATAHAMDSVREKCEAAGFDGFHTKPIDFDSLLQTMQHLLTLRGR